MLVSLPIFCAQKMIVGGRRQLLLWQERPCLACLLLLLSSSRQVYKLMDINYPCSPALAEPSLTWRLIPN